MQAKDLKAVVVDDEDLLRMTVTMLFRRAGVPEENIREAINGAEALELLEGETPDVVLTDVDMPGGNGIDMTRAIRANPKFKDVKIIMTSGYDRTEDAKAVGAHTFMQKPYTREQFQAALTSVLGITADTPTANETNITPPPAQTGSQPGTPETT